MWLQLEPDLTGSSGVNKTTDLKQQGRPLVTHVSSLLVIPSDLFRQILWRRGQS